MARLMQNITDESIQVHTVVYNDVEATLTLRYCSQVESWFIDAVVGNKQVYGIRLSLGVFHLRSRNMPIDIIVTDKSGEGIDPFKANDFSQERCSIIILDDDDMEAIRGQRVQF